MPKVSTNYIRVPSDGKVERFDAAVAHHAKCIRALSAVIPF